MKKIIIPVLVIISLVLVIGINEVNALELNTEYFMDSKNAFMIMSVDSSGETSLLEGGIVVSGEWEYWDQDSLKISRILNDGDAGRFFGRTDEGNLFYAIYEINGDSVNFNVKVWHDGIKTKIIDKGIISPLF